MNYHHVEQEAPAGVAPRVYAAAKRKEIIDAERIERLNQLTRYPSWAALIATGVALISVAVHVIR